MLHPNPRGGAAMTNGGDRHHDHESKKKKPGSRKPADEAKAKLKRRNLLPKALAGKSGR